MKITGTGVVASTDYHKVEWKGLRKDGEAITIKLDKAINMGNIDLAFAEKGETVAQVVYTAVYANTDSMSTETKEPWEIETSDSTSASGEIILGAGIFYIDDVAVALTRGGGSFNVARTFRPINADGDRGPVEGRIAIDDSTATLTLNTLQILSIAGKLYAGVNVATE